MAGHYPNADIAKLVALKHKDTKIIVVKEPELIEGETGDHAGKWETSLLLVLFPKLVDLMLMDGKEDRLSAVEGDDPANSTVEYGNELLKKMISRIVKLLR
ncbi:creatininase family protein [Candidatus Gottesmanbacteria bacterium]|nr:creatininase family protein [Candidatus Gottesmanbacteria bacterium]